MFGRLMTRRGPGLLGQAAIHDACPSAAEAAAAPASTWQGQDLRDGLDLAVSVVVTDESGNVLLQRSSEGDFWSIPGGGMQPGESFSHAVARAMKEETGFDVEPTGLVGLYSYPVQLVVHPKGEVRQEFSICFKARLVRGDASSDKGESKELCFVSAHELSRLTLHRSARASIQHFLDGRAEPYFV
jgi:ADP-ribose pyrophosphatase YjhB (NUDIX family)